MRASSSVKWWSLLDVKITSTFLDEAVTFWENCASGFPSDVDLQLQTWRLMFEATTSPSKKMKKKRCLADVLQVATRHASPLPTTYRVARWRNHVPRDSRDTLV